MAEPTPERPAFAAGYGISAEPEGMLPWSWLSERMAESRNYWIGTTRPDGRPHMMPVWGVWLDETFYFGTGRESAKARNLARNRRSSSTSRAATTSSSSRAEPKR